MLSGSHSLEKSVAQECVVEGPKKNEGWFFREGEIYAERTVSLPMDPVGGPFRFLDIPTQSPYIGLRSLHDELVERA